MIHYRFFQNDSLAFRASVIITDNSGVIFLMDEMSVVQAGHVYDSYH